MSQYSQVAVSTPTVIYPFKLKNVEKYTLANAVTTKYFQLAQAPMAAIILQFDMLGNAAAATIANALTQCITSLKITDGGKDITPNWSGAEWYEYLNAFYGHICPFQDGSAADNKLALLQMVIPFGRSSAIQNPSLLSMFDQMVGFVPKATPQVEWVYPADANSIDTRHLKISVVYMNSKPSYTSRWTSWSTQTLNTSGGVDWVLPSSGLLAEMFMYQTSSYNDTLTADAPTLLDWDLTQAGKSMISDGKMFNMFGALQNVAAQPDDDYILVPFSKYPADDFSMMPKLGNDTRFTAFGGVADDFKLAVKVLETA